MLKITTKVLFFGAASEIVGASEIEFLFAETTNAAHAFSQILEKFPKLRTSFKNSLLFAVNQTYADGSEIIKTGDELAIFPPVSGG